MEVRTNLTLRGAMAVLAVMLLGAGAFAQDIRIVKSGAEKTGIDVSGIRADGPAGAEFVQTLKNDLTRSGWFRVLPSGAPVSVSGAVASGGRDVDVTLDVLQAASGKRYARHGERVSVAEVRRAAHRAADAIVQAVKGKRGIAASRIVLIGSTGGRKDLYLCDADGQGFMQLTQDGKPCLSPNWDPTGQQIYYTSFHGGYPDVYRVSLDTLRRSRISAQPGLNAGADIAPDGRLMALTLSRDGNPELYIMHLTSGRLERLTETRHAAEASPSWSPDGRSIVFVSDRSGSPQLYVVSRSGGGARRISFRGNENVSPDWGPDGRIVYSSRRAGRYQLSVMDANGGNEAQLTDGNADHEEPSWAPNGRHLVYVRTVGYRMEVYILDTLGDPEVRLTTLAGDWYSPDWSP